MAETGITVYTTTQNTYQVANGASFQSWGVSPTGELAGAVLGVPPAANEDPGAGPWLGSFASVEAVYLNGEVVAEAPAAAKRGGL